MKILEAVERVLEAVERFWKLSKGFGDLFWDWFVARELRVLRYHYIRFKSNKCHN
jgi:hypothetical protein